MPCTQGLLASLSDSAVQTQQKLTFFAELEKMALTCLLCLGHNGQLLTVSSSARAADTTLT